MSTPSPDSVPADSPGSSSAHDPALPPRPEHGATPAPRLELRYQGISFEERMATVDFRVGARAHIAVDSDICRSCTTKECVTACPANLFAPTADGGILFNYEECFECGTCYMVCNSDGAITWTYPDGGHGVVFRHG